MPQRIMCKLFNLTFKALHALHLTHVSRSFPVSYSRACWVLVKLDFSSFPEHNAFLINFNGNTFFLLTEKTWLIGQSSDERPNRYICG